MTNIQSRLTPYDDAYGTCSKTHVKLRIYPGSLSPSDITSRLRLQPTQVNVAGEKRVSPSGRVRVLPFNAWFLSSEEDVRSLDLRRHLDWLLARLSPEAAALLSLQDEPGLRMSVNCVWWSRSGHGGPTLWPEQMRVLSDLNLECSFDIYLSSEDEE